MEKLGYTHGRREIPGFPNWFVDASCRIWSIKNWRPPNEWPYATISTPLGDVYLDVAEVAALCFLGEAGCNEAYRKLALIPRLKPHDGECRAIAKEYGISYWAVFAASKQPVANFVVRRFAELVASGTIDETMRLHSAEGTVSEYKIFELEDKPGLFDHVLKIGAGCFRTRRYDKRHVANMGSAIRFRYRLDVQGGMFLVPSTVKQIEPVGN